MLPIFSPFPSGSAAAAPLGPVGPEQGKSDAGDVTFGLLVATHALAETGDPESAAAPVSVPQPVSDATAGRPRSVTRAFTGGERPSPAPAEASTDSGARSMGQRVLPDPATDLFATSVTGESASAAGARESGPPAAEPLKGIGLPDAPTTGDGFGAPPTAGPTPLTTPAGPLRDASGLGRRLAGPPGTAPNAVSRTLVPENGQREVQMSARPLPPLPAPGAREVGAAGEAPGTSSVPASAVGRPPPDQGPTAVEKAPPARSGVSSGGTPVAEARTVADPSSRVRAPTGLNEAGVDMPASRRSEQAGGDLPPSPRVSVAAPLGNMGEVEVRVVPSRSGLKQDASVTARPASARPPSAMAVGAPGRAGAPSGPLAERGALGEAEGQAVATVAAGGRPPAPTTPPWKVGGSPVDTGAGATGAVAAAPVARGSFVQAAAPEGEPANAGAPAPHSEPGAVGQETRTRAAAIREAGTMGPAPAATAVTAKLLSAEQAMAIGGGDAQPGGETGSRGSDGEPMPLGADAPSRAGAPTQLVQGPDATRANTVVRQIAEAAGLKTDGGVEVSLSPEELGRVKLTMTPQEAGLAITILAERAETLELLRRHIDVLARDLADQGFTSLSFDFGQAGGDAGGQAGGGGLDDLARGAAEPPARAGRESRPSGSHQSGLDLRL